MKKILVPLFAFAFAFALMYSAYYLFPGFGSLVDKYVPWIGGSLSGENSFRNLVGGDTVVLEYQPFGPEATPAVGVFYQFLQDSEAYARENENTAYWQNWNWETHFFGAKVTYSDAGVRTASLDFNSPDTLGQKSGVSLLCEPENNVSFYQENLTLKLTNFDIFEELEAGDLLYSKCVNEACTSAGKYCFLIKNTPLTL